MKERAEGAEVPSVLGAAKKGTTDKFSTTILAHLFCPHFVGKSST